MMFFLILKLLDVCSLGTDQLGRSEEGDIFWLFQHGFSNNIFFFTTRISASLDYS